MRLCIYHFFLGKQMSKYRLDYMALNAPKNFISQESLIDTGLGCYCELLNSALTMTVFKYVVANEYAKYSMRDTEVSFEYCVNKLKKMGYFNYKMKGGLINKLKDHLLFVSELING